MPDDIPHHPIPWKFAPHPVTLTREEFWERYSHRDMPEKFEATNGKLFWADEQRHHVLGMLIESLGTEAVEAFITEHRQR